MTSNPIFPPLDGSISIIPGLVDFHAQHNPSNPWAVLAPESGSNTTSVSFREFSNATHRIALVFRPDATHSDGDIVAVLVNCDSVLYLALLVGLVRAGYVVRSSSIMNRLLFILERT